MQRLFAPVRVMPPSGAPIHIAARIRQVVSCASVTRLGLATHCSMSDATLVSFPAFLPRGRLLLAAVICLAASAACVVMARQVPRLGLSFQRSGSTVTRVLDTPVAGTPLQRGDTIVHLAATPGGPEIALRDDDVLEEPDYLIAWAAQDAFFARQSTLEHIARASRVQVDARRADGTSISALIAPTRADLSVLSWMFWLQLMVGAAGVMVGAWIWSLRPQEWSARLYALTGLGLMLAVDASAVYGARELSLPSVSFQALSAINHLGGMLFCGALCAWFLVYPRPLVRPSSAAMLVPTFCVWWAINALHLTPDQRWATGTLGLALLATLAAAALQWRATRGDPADRAVLRWLGATVLASCVAVIAASLLPVLASGTTTISQGVTFLLILPMYLGLAVGLRQHRLFALDQWAFRLLFWGVGMMAMLMIDVWLVGILGTGGVGAITIAALLAFSTAPMRRWAWGTRHRRHASNPLQLYRDVLHVASAASHDDRDQRWRLLLRTWFSPLHAVDDDARMNAGVPMRTAHLMAQGRELAVPATAVSAPLRLSFANGGARLFTPDDAQLVDTACALLTITEESRSALAEGMRLERVRIARDLHDTVSSPLLAGLRPMTAASSDDLQLEAMQSDIRRAITGMRSVVAGPGQTGILLRDLLADLRYASAERLQAAALTLEWPIVMPPDEIELPAGERHALTAFVQESITNVIRHAAATVVEVSVQFSPAHELTLVIADDGRGFDKRSVVHGDGMTNLHARALALGGAVRIQSRPAPHRGTSVTLVTAAFGAAPAAL